jgi:hypothetical protein
MVTGISFSGAKRPRRDADHSPPSSVVVLLLLFCSARWLMPPDVPQPVRLIVLTLLKTFQLSLPVVSRVHIPRAILVAKAGTIRARNGRLILPRRRLPRNV